MEDRKIVELYHARDESAIAETNRKYGRYCHAIAYRILRSDRDSEECVSDTWLRAWDSMPPKKPDVLSVFLGKITRNLSLDRVKLRMASKRGGGHMEAALDELLECIPSEDFADRIIDDMELTELLNGFLSDLSVQNRIIFMQRYWHMLSIKEIAGQMKLKESAIKMSLMRSRKRLEMLMKEKGVVL